MEELTKFHVDWKKIVVVGLLVVLTGLTTGGLTWYVADSGRDAELDAKDQTISDLETRIAQLEADAAPTEEDAAKESLYTNTEYKFTLQIPTSWEGYRVTKSTEATYGATANYRIELPTTVANYASAKNGYMSLMTISIYTEEQWNAVQAVEGPKPALLGTTGSGNIAAYSTAQDAPSDLVSKFTDANINSIVSSFKATN